MINLRVRASKRRLLAIANVLGTLMLLLLTVITLFFGFILDRGDFLTRCEKEIAAETSNMQLKLDAEVLLLYAKGGQNTLRATAFPILVLATILSSLSSVGLWVRAKREEELLEKLKQMEK